MTTDEVTMQFLLIISHDKGFRPDEKLVSEIGQWIKRAEKVGVRILGKPLRPASEARTVRIRDGAPEMISGPFSASEEQMCAFELLECERLEQAMDLACEHPMAHAATIEGSPVWEKPGVAKSNEVRR